MSDFYKMVDDTPLNRAVDRAVAEENRNALAFPAMRLYRFTISWQGDSDSYAVLDNLTPIPGEGGYSREDAIKVCQRYRDTYKDKGVLV